MARRTRETRRRRRGEVLSAQCGHPHHGGLLKRGLLQRQGTRLTSRTHQEALSSTHETTIIVGGGGGSKEEEPARQSAAHRLGQRGGGAGARVLLIEDEEEEQLRRKGVLLIEEFKQDRNSRKSKEEEENMSTKEEQECPIETDGVVLWDPIEQMTNTDAEYLEFMEAKEKFMAGLPPYPGTPTIPSPAEDDEDENVDSPTPDTKDPDDEEAAFEEIIFGYKNMERLDRHLKALYGRYTQ